MIDGKELYGIEDQMKELEADESHSDSLQSITNALLEKAESQRKDIGKSYPVHNALCRASKGLIKAWKSGKVSKGDRYWQLITRLWSILGAADVPRHVSSQHDNESGQEIVEAEIVKALWPIAFAKNCPISEIEGRVRQVLESIWTKLGDPEADPNLAMLADVEEEKLGNGEMKPEERRHLMSIPYQAWLGGAGDSVGEISKILENQLNAHRFEEMIPLNSDENTQLICQTIATMRAVYDFLECFETCYGQAINASQRRGFFNTFRGTIVKSEKEVRRWSDKLLDINLREACDAKVIAKLSQHS